MSADKAVTGMRPGRRHVKLRAFLVTAAILVAWLLIALTQAGRDALNLLYIVSGLSYLGYLFWELAANRKHRRHKRREAAEEAEAQRQRLEAALSHGSYRPEPTVPRATPGAAERLRQDLLDATERHGSLSPEARAAAARLQAARKSGLGS